MFKAKAYRSSFLPIPLTTAFICRNRTDDYARLTSTHPHQETSSAYGVQTASSPAPPRGKLHHLAAAAVQAPDLLYNFTLRFKLCKYAISASAALCVPPDTAKGNLSLLYRPKVLY